MEIITNRNNIKVIIGGKTPRERRAYHLHVVGITDSGGMYALIPLSIRVAMVLQSFWILGNNIDNSWSDLCQSCRIFPSCGTRYDISGGNTITSKFCCLNYFFGYYLSAILLASSSSDDDDCCCGGCYKLLYELFISLLFGTG